MPLTFDRSIDDLRDYIRSMPKPTDDMVRIGEAALDDYYAGTKDAPIEGSFVHVYQAMAALAPNREEDAHNVALAAALLRSKDYEVMAKRLDVVAERLWPKLLEDLAQSQRENQ